MKILLAFVLFFGIRDTGAQSGCDICEQGTLKVLNFLNSEESLGRQVDLLIERACPAFEDGCDAGVRTWWPKLGNVVYSAPDLPGQICGYIDPSCANQRTWDCDTCKQRIPEISVAVNAGTEIIVEALAGARFCGDPGNNFSPEDMATCREFVEDFIPVATPVLTGAVSENSNSLCQEVFDQCKG